jgi:hypothetical protein
MRHFLPSLCLWVVFAAACCAAFQVAEGVKSGLQPGEQIPGAFHSLNINGAHAGNPHCLICEYGLDPVVLIFARESANAGEPLTNLLRKLDEAMGRYQAVHGMIVFLSDDFAKVQSRQRVITDLENFAKDLKNVVVSVDGPAGPDKYKINEKAEISVLMYRKHKVVENLVFSKGKLTDKEIATVLAAVDKLAK